MSMDKLDVDLIEVGAANRYIGGKVIVYKSTASTNDVAWEYARNEENGGLAVFAEAQSDGRGRLGRQWLSGDGESLLCSMLLVGCATNAELLTIAAAVGVAEAIRKTCGVEARIKWPNDIMIGGKKTAGILVESRRAKGRINYVIGVGINCHQGREFFKSRKLKMAGTSLDIEAGKEVDRNKLAIALLGAIDTWTATAVLDSSRIIDRWSRLSSQLGHHVTVESDSRRYSGNCIGVDPKNGLILQLDEGAVRMFDASHTTIIKHL